MVLQLDGLSLLGCLSGNDGLGRLVLTLFTWVSSTERHDVVDLLLGQGYLDNNRFRLVLSASNM